MQPLEMVFHQRPYGGLIKATAGNIDWLDAVFVAPHIEFGNEAFVGQIDVFSKATA
jgi:hypothetical protein